MEKNRKDASLYLIDIGYKDSMNAFHEFYRGCVTYTAIEQESYIDLKSMVYELVSEKIKFRKHERKDMILTLKVEMLDAEKEKFIYLLNKDKFRFFHNYEIKDFRKFKIEDENE